MKSLKNPYQNDDETINQGIEDAQLKIEVDNKVIEYTNFTNLSLIRYFSNLYFSDQN